MSILLPSWPPHEYLKMLNDAKVASVRFLNDKVLATRINQEKKFEPYFQVPLKYTIYLPDYKDGMLNILDKVIFRPDRRTDNGVRCP